MKLAGISETAGEAAVGLRLDALRPAAGLRISTGLQSLFYPLYTLTAGQIPAALDMLSPTPYADGLMAVRQAWYQGTSAISDQLADRRSGLASANAVAGPHGTTIWVSGIGQFINVSGSSGSGYNTSIGGAVAGIDMPFTPEIDAGVALGGSSLQTTTGNGSKVNGNLVQFSLYGDYHTGAIVIGGLPTGGLFVEGQADYVHVDEDVRHQVGFAHLSARGSTPVQGGGAQVNSGLRFDVQNVQLEPTLGLTALSLSSAAASETNVGGLAETIGSFSTTSLQTFAGLRVATAARLTPTITVQLRGIVGWSHELADVTSRASSGFSAMSGSGAFSASSAPVGRDAIRIGGGFDVAVASNVSLYASYTASLSHDMTEQNLTRGVRIR